MAKIIAQKIMLPLNASQHLAKVIQEENSEEFLEAVVRKIEVKPEVRNTEMGVEMEWIVVVFTGKEGREILKDLKDKAESGDDKAKELLAMFKQEGENVHEY